MARNVDLEELDAMIDKLANLTDGQKEVRELFRAEHDAARAEMHTMVQGNLRGSAKTWTGKTASWQEKYIGSGGGYAAVRPSPGNFQQFHKEYSKGYVTNAIESGHRKRTRKSWTKHGYHPRKDSSDRVEGLHFYMKARSQMEAVAQRHAESLMKKIEEALEAID